MRRVQLLHPSFLPTQIRLPQSLSSQQPLLDLPVSELREPRSKQQQQQNINTHKGTWAHTNTEGVDDEHEYTRKRGMNTHAYMYTYIHTYIYTHTHMYIYIHTHTYTHKHIHTYISIYIQTYIHIHTYIHTYTYIHIHTYIHTYMHTHIHGYPRTSSMNEVVEVNRCRDFGGSITTRANTFTWGQRCVCVCVRVCVDRLPTQTHLPRRTHGFPGLQKPQPQAAATGKAELRSLHAPYWKETPNTHNNNNNNDNGKAHRETERPRQTQRKRWSFVSTTKRNESHLPLQKLGPFPNRS